MLLGSFTKSDIISSQENCNPEETAEIDVYLIIADHSSIGSKRRGQMGWPSGRKQHSSVIN
jgi:hypothetical protein